MQSESGFSQVVGLGDDGVSDLENKFEVVDLGLESWEFPANRSEPNEPDDEVVPRGAWNYHEEVPRRKGRGPRLVDVAKIATELPYNKASGRNRVPKCMQGIIWMDQTCSTKHRLPWGYSCNNPIWANEYVTSLGKWNPKRRCLTLRRDAWTYGTEAKGRKICKAPAPRFCQTNADKYPDPCSPGAYFKGPMAPGLGKFDLEKTSFGWDRVSFSPLLSVVKAHYPVLPIVDGSGKPTEWFDSYMAEVTQTSCGFLGFRCRLNQWATSKKMAVCSR